MDRQIPKIFLNLIQAQQKLRCALTSQITWYYEIIVFEQVYNFHSLYSRCIEVKVALAIVEPHSLYSRETDKRTGQV